MILPGYGYMLVGIRFFMWALPKTAALIVDNTLPLDHIALETEGLMDAVARLEEAGIDYRMVDVPGREMKQIFVRDPDGVALELNFHQPRSRGSRRRRSPTCA